MKQYIVFVDDIDGDVYQYIEDAIEALKYAFEHGANKVEIKILEI